MVISVIIPAYNEQNYIKKTLKCILNQSLNRVDYEVIVCNDCSTDKTSLLACKIADKVIDLKKQKTISAVRNAGAKIAKGKILVFLDADTLVDRDFLKLIHEKFDEGFKFCLPKQIYDNKKFGLFYELNWFILKRFNFGFFGGCGLAVSKDLFFKINGFNEELEMREDVDLKRKISKEGLPACFIESTVISSSRKLKLGFFRLIKYGLQFLANPKKIKYLLVR